MNLLHVATKYVDAGIGVLPLRFGSKAPALAGWQPYQNRLPSRAELEAWFDHYPAQVGIGMICGRVSGGLEVIDFDMAELFWPWVSNIGDAFNSLAIVETPSGGWHAIYRCRAVTGNRKLAMWEAVSGLSEREHNYRSGTKLESIGKGVRIETRGEGGYVVAEGSPCRTHLNGLPYVQAFGPILPNVREISPSTREHLWKAAMEFDCSIDKKSAALQRARRMVKKQMLGELRRDESAPWTWFDYHGPPILETLSKQGWTTTDGRTLTRPGKTFGTSAVVSVNEAGEEVLTVYSTSVGCLSPINGQAHASFGKFNLLVQTEFGGDRRAAASHVNGLMRDKNYA